MRGGNFPVFRTHLGKHCRKGTGAFSSGGLLKPNWHWLVQAAVYMSSNLFDAFMFLLFTLGEERNFAEFNYVNEQNDQKERLWEQIDEVSEGIRDPFLFFLEG